MRVSRDLLHTSQEGGWSPIISDLGGGKEKAKWWVGLPEKRPINRGGVVLFLLG